MKEVDYIIVGQGIAGSNLGFELLKRNKRIAIFDPSWHDAACLVAAGVINPITGQRLVKSWRSEVAHPYAKTFYKQLEKHLSASFFHDRKILQLCKSPEEHDLWAKRKLDKAYSVFIGEGSCRECFEGLNDNFGHHFIERSAWVEPEAIMVAFKKFFCENNVLFDEEFDYSQLSMSTSDCFTYKNFKAKGVIFCEGWQVLKNPYFNWLPYRCAKGEILQLRADCNIPNHIIHRGNWIMKCATNMFRIGSTWDRQNLNSIPTETAKIELLKAVENIVISPKNVEVCKHSAGVRPCTATTRPHLGEHPKHKGLYSFNGFGSKGYALSPYFAREFADFLEGKKSIDTEANLNRHIKRFFNYV